MNDTGKTLESPLERLALSEADSDLPGLRTVKLSPWGQVKSKQGDYVLDDDAARLILAEFHRHGVAVPVDIEHETVKEPGKRGAVGWIERVFAESGRGLFGLVRWSDAGRELIRADSYRYLSPVFGVQVSDRRAAVLHSAAITNKPAIPHMERLAASETPLMEQWAMMEGNNDPKSLIEELAKLLGVTTGDDPLSTLIGVRDALKAKMAEGNEASPPQANAERPSSELLAMREENKALRVQLNQQELIDFLAPYVAKGVLSNDPKNPFIGKVDYREFMVLAESNRDVAKRWLDERVAMLPKQTQLTDGGPLRVNQSRMTIIANAEREFDATPGHQKATSKRAFVNMRLREAELVALTDDEAKGYVLVR